MEPVGFDHQLLIVNLNDLLAKLEDPPIPQLVSLLRETLKIFQQMGGALAMAFSGFLIGNLKKTLKNEEFFRY